MQVTLGTDGFGRSDTRAALREFFEVDAASIVIAALDSLHAEAAVDAVTPQAARVRYGRNNDPGASWTR